jgi:multiple sugar transport system substrate-binding protein
MRARTSLVALVVLVFLTAAGCGGGAGETGGGKAGGGDRLTFWTAEDNPDRVKATGAIIDRFERQTRINVDVVAIGEDQLVSRINSASAGGSLPDVLGALSLAFVHSLAADHITDAGAAAEVIDMLGRESFSRRGLALVESDGKPVAIPSDSWAQLLVYRKDLFDKASLAPPTTFQAIRAGAARLTSGGMVGIVAATKPDDSFTQQTFEYLALANGCELVDARANIDLASKLCVDTFAFYVDLIRSASVKGAQDADSTRAAYLAGKSAMVIWSSFILDELAGLSADAPPTCAQCRRDKAFLSKNSGIVTAIKGPGGTEPSQFGELTSFAITKDANREAAKKLVAYLMDDGYVDWLALAPEGKVPLRVGSQDDPSKFADAWNDLKTGRAREPLSKIYPAEVLRTLATSADTMNRWGFPQGQAALAAAQLSELPVPKALAAALDGTLQPAAAAEQAQADMERIARPLR